VGRVAQRGRRFVPRGPRIHIVSPHGFLLQPAIGFLLSPQKQAGCGTRFKVEENVNSFITAILLIRVFCHVINFQISEQERIIISMRVVSEI
jgi:hypothetical protein